jgi:hypothetical protein
MTAIIDKIKDAVGKANVETRFTAADHIVCFDQAKQRFELWYLSSDGRVMAIAYDDRRLQAYALRQAKAAGMVTDTIDVEHA